MRRRILGVCAVLAIGVVTGLVLAERPSTSQSTDPSRETAGKYTGAQACAGCHRTEFKAWKGSHHEQAMQHADAKTVLGDFNDAHFEYSGVKTRFFKRGDQFFVNTDGADGKLKDFAVKYTFGVYPLQQYLVEFPGGRLQALSTSWDARPKSQGGQRWYRLYPTEKIDHNDELHWTKLSQNWNNMCSGCHSTNVKKGFDLASNSFQTTWSEINVSCESCHGAGARHVAWANKAAGTKDLENLGLENRLDEHKGVAWVFLPNQNIATRSRPRLDTKEIDTCGRCHSRRSELKEDDHFGKPLMDSHLPSLLTAPLFYPDGQIKEEDFEYASFLQSKMYHQGVTCSDCHEPHSQKLRANGSETCLNCHQSDHYNSKSHHHHEQANHAVSCISCHMPSTNFMVVHARHDHSIRIPRPDLSRKLKTPNACNQCHADKTPNWAESRMNAWYGKLWHENWHFGETLHSASGDLPGLTQDLLALTMAPKLPDIARATAASLLPRYLDQSVFVVLPQMLKDRSAMVRRASLGLLEALPMDQRWKIGAASLNDPILSVRIEAARVLAGVPRPTLSADERISLDRGLQEYVDAAMSSAEHPQSHVNLALLYLAQGDVAQAEKSYREAIRIGPEYTIAYVNLADLYSVQQQPEKVEAILRQGQALLPGNADIMHSLGLHYVRQKKMPMALEALGAAARHRRDNLRYSYVFAVALFESGYHDRSIKLLNELAASHPHSGEVLMALVAFNLKLGATEVARGYAQRMLKDDPRLGSVEQIMGLDTR
jgi:tetratricopeptide (TPR) repeat protein